jgi:hypothetical protein
LFETFGTLDAFFFAISELVRGRIRVAPYYALSALKWARPILLLIILLIPTWDAHDARARGVFEFVSWLAVFASSNLVVWR